MTRRLIWFCWLGLAACDDGAGPAAPPVEDAGRDAAPMDRGAPDRPIVEDAAVDLAPRDALVDQARVDGAIPDARVIDAAPIDAAPLDAGPPADADPPDAALDAAPPVDAAPPPVDAAPDQGCAPLEPWSRRVEATGGALTFNEVLADAADPALEWIELHNTLDIDLDASGWALTDGVEYTFPEGTLVPARGYLVVAAAPDQLRAARGIEALGPYTGRLAAGGERLALHNNAGRLMDAIDWVPGQRWPDPLEDQTLAKGDPRAASGWGEAWRVGPPGGTPGAQNFAPPRGGAPTVLVDADAAWRHGPRAPGVEAVAFDDAAWPAAPAPFFVGAPTPLDVPVRLTADNHFALYAGGPEGEGLRLIGRDAVGDWSSVEDFVVRLGPAERLYVAAWEAVGPDGGPQMMIMQATPPGGAPVGSGEDLEALFGPPDASPGGNLAAPAPPVEEVAAVIAGAAWAPPAARRPDGAAPWGSRGFQPGIEFVWPDTFENVSRNNTDETYALFRTTRSILPPPGATGLDAAPRSLAFRTRFAFAGDPAAIDLSLDLLVDDGAVVWLNGVEVHRQNLPAGAIDADTPAVEVIEAPAWRRRIPLAAAPLVQGENVLTIAVHQADEAPADLRFAARLEANARPPEPAPPVTPITGAVVIDEIMYHPADDDPRGEWIELHVPGDAPVDLAGWQLVDGTTAILEGALPAGGFGVVVADPEAFAVAHPDVQILGVLEGGLANTGERIALRDPCGVIVDAVHYRDRGRWPADADGFGPSLELRDPRADNALGSAWAASLARGEWVDVAWEGPAGRTVVGPDGQWEELVIGLLDAGEVLIDDVSVIADPAGAATELIANGGFGDGTSGWRIIGTHRHSAVVPDPDDPANPVLRLVATGATEHMHNHAEITLAGGHVIDPATIYRVSYRARWVRGSNQLNARLYFNRLARTVRIPRPAGGGTPGAPSSTRLDLGPGCRGLIHDPPVPLPGEPASVQVDLHDPDGVIDATLHVAVNGGAFAPVAMIDGGDGRYSAPLPTDAPGDRVQFYVEAEDGAGHRSLCPPGGPASRALARVDDGALPAGATLPPLRLWMTPEDEAFLHGELDLMSNDRLGATVVDGDGNVFYDVGVRLKGSQRGRPQRPRLGYSLAFDPEQLFRGVHPSVSVDRSEGVGYGQRELLIDLVMARAGSVSAEYNDLGWLLSPRPEHHGPALLQLARFGDLLLANQFEDGADGALYEFELIYFPTTTADGSPTGRKRPAPDSVVGTAPRGLGDDPEAYRHIYQVKNNRRRDDFAAIMAFAQVFDLPDPEFFARIEDVIDVDQWLRAFAFSALCGAVDHFADGANHNVQLYVRPSDGRVLFFPHDLDFYQNARRAIVARAELRRLLTRPRWRRAFYGHLHDVLALAYDPEWLGHWRDHLGALLPGQNFAAHHAFMIERAAFVRQDAGDSILNTIPEVPFAITTEGPVAGPEALLEGTAWIDVWTLVGPDGVIEPTWIDDHTWQASVRVPGGVRALRLEAHGRAGLIGEASIAVE